jgi:uncharacterized OB-fold protein
LPEQDGLRVLANIVETDIQAVHVGMRVRLVLEDRDGWIIPQFTSF